MTTTSEDSADQVDLSGTPIRALSISSRSMLSQYLNPEQVLMTSKGLPRDHRGLAELMGFSYAEARNYQRTTDPTRSLLEMFEIAGGKEEKPRTFQNLTNMLEEIERYDIIDDLMQSLLSDARLFANRKNQMTSPNDGTPSKSDSNKFKDAMQTFRSDSNQIYTIHDAINSEATLYDAYICYADADSEFVHKLTAFLESEEIGLKLLVRERDLLVGAMEQDAIMKLIEMRCRRMLIILTPDFLESSECEFQTRFATGLAIEQRTRKLIPVIYKKCDLPPVIRFLSKIDLSRGDQSASWNWKKLVVSIRDSKDVANGLACAASFMPCHSQMAIKGPLTLCSTNKATVDILSSRPEPSAPLATSSHITELDSLPAYSDLPSPTESSLVSRQQSVISNVSSASSKASSSKRGWLKSIKQKITRTSYAHLES